MFKIVAYGAEHGVKTKQIPEYCFLVLDFQVSERVFEHGFERVEGDGIFVEFGRIENAFLFFSGHLSLVHAFGRQLHAKLERLPAILRKDRFAAQPFRLAVETREVILAVVFHLKRVSGKQRCAVFEKDLHQGLVTLEKSVVVVFSELGFRNVHGEDKRRLLRGAQRLAEVVVVQILEEETFQKRAHFACDVAEIDRAAEDHNIRFVRPFQDCCQIVFLCTAPEAFPVFQFARHAADACAEFEVVQVDHLRFRSGGGGSFQYFFQQGVGVPVLSWTAVDGHDFHSGILSIFVVSVDHAEIYTRFSEKSNRNQQEEHFF